MVKHGSVCWNELNTRDAEKAKAFYGESMGWTFDRVDMGDAEPYWVAKDSGEMRGGIFTMSGPYFEGIPDHWLTIFEVDDVDARVAEARSNGATILREPWDVPGVGRLAIVCDPGGAGTAWLTSVSPGE